MKYATYEEYKPSQIEWLGAIPQHWEIWKIAHGFQMTGSGTTPPPDNPEWYEGDVCWVTTSELRETVITDTEKKISQEALRNFSALKIFPVGALAIAMYGATIGRLGIFGVEAATNQACGVLYGPKAFDTKFVFYWLRAFREQIIILASGGGQPNISQEKVRSIRIACPCVDEQQTIARFLDARTAQIDALLAQKLQLIDKLKEKRQALIARTVTRGLPPEAAKAAGLEPNPEMKNSGVVWIGEIPTHWICAKTAFFFSAGMGQTILKEELTDEGLPVYSATEGDHFFGRLMDPKLRLYRGDIVVPARGNSIGHVKLVNEESTTTQTTIYFKNRVPHRIDSEYAFFLMKGLRHHLFEFDQTAIPQITVDQVLGNPVLIPPIDEQLAICKFLKMKETEASDMLQTVEAAIDRLTEYRQALITSAVTGKIDVRELE